MKPIQVLLSGAIDYAGLFPPAELAMEQAVANQSAYQGGADAWALGRFIVPVSRLPELQRLIPPRSNWKLSALVGSDITADLDRVRSFRPHGADAPMIDTVELKADSVETIHSAMDQAGPGLQVYFELPVDHEPAELIGAVARSGAQAKVRTGGVTPNAFPSTADLARFIYACVREQVPFKATAGLHHPLRADYPYTYQVNSRRGPMFGFLNLFLSTALLRSGSDLRSASEMLEERSPAELQVDERSVTWRDHRLDLSSLHRARESMMSFGSCSFTEPLSELRGLGFLEAEAQPA
jgi:hypothetical protein